jgi:hypothetical protein
MALVKVKDDGRGWIDDPKIEISLRINICIVQKVLLHGLL